MITRRDMLRASILTASAVALPRFATRLLAGDYNAPVKGAAGLTAYLKDARILVRYDNLPVLCYRAGSDNKYPYFYPLSGPRSGISLTTESSLPYPHHRGLWLGCDPLNGGNYWGDNGPTSGQIVSRELTLQPAGDSPSVEFIQSCAWVREGSNPFNDERRVVVTRPDDDHVLIDCEFILTAGEDVSIRGAKHSFFAMRAASDISPAYGGTLVNSEGGTGARGTYGRTANWCGFYGARRKQPDVTEGIVIMNHPENFGGNCPWFTRDYGHLSPSPFNFLKEPWTLKEGETLGLRYRVVLFGGTPEQAGLDTIFKMWLNG